MLGMKGVFGLNLSFCFLLLLLILFELLRPLAFSVVQFLLDLLVYRLFLDRFIYAGYGLLYFFSIYFLHLVIIGFLR